MTHERQTPQSEAAKPTQRKNAAGGYSFVVDDWTRLERFLVIGAEGGSFHVGERKLIRDNAQALHRCIQADGLRTVATIVQISDAGRAPRNDEAIFALAVCASEGSPRVKYHALAAISKVCRTSTHLYQFVEDVGQMRGWGPALKSAVARWYTERPIDSLAMQAIKYQSRNGWSHRDVLRLAHPYARDIDRDALFRWMTAGMAGFEPKEELLRRDRKPCARRRALSRHHLPELVHAFEQIHADGVTVPQAVALVEKYRLPHECVPNEMKGDPRIWEALLEHMGPTALLRQLAKMTAVGLLAPMRAATRRAVEKLTDPTLLFRGRVHPMRVLMAARQYQTGHGDKGKLAWSPTREILDALDEAFYLSFEAIEPTGQRTLLGLDISGSMDSLLSCGLSAREASAAMSMVTAKAEKHWHAVAFTSMDGMRSQGLTPVNFTPKARLGDIVSLSWAMAQRMGRTDCALPMLYAMQQKIEVDAFVIYTDNETWAGSVHPHQALAMYRDRMGIPAKLVAVAFEAAEFTVADPDDAGSMDVVGLDAATPSIIADFVADRRATRAISVDESEVQ